MGIPSLIFGIGPAMPDTGGRRWLPFDYIATSWNWAPTFELLILKAKGDSGLGEREPVWVKVIGDTGLRGEFFRAEEVTI